MLRAIIIEDEIHAMEAMKQLLGQLSMEIEIKAELRSVRESIDYFQNNSSADIIFSDAQLSDGLSFEIFQQTVVQTPIIFTTDYDQFMLMAFENNGIDYLLKPVNKMDLEKALLKYKRLQTHFYQTQIGDPVEKLIRVMNGRKKERLLVRKGIEHIALKLEKIALIYTENKLVYVVDHSGTKYLCDKTLSDLEQELDNMTFFRVNRQYIININYVKSFKPFEKVKLLVDITIPEISHNIIISQETAPAFRKWMLDA